MDAGYDGRVTGAHEVALDALAELGLRDPHPAIDHLVREYEEASHTSRVEAVEGAVPVLAALHARGVRMRWCATPDSRRGVSSAATERAVHAGDLRRTDIAGACAIGMASVRSRGAYDDPSPPPDADAVIDAHEELLGVSALEPQSRVREDV